MKKTTPMCVKNKIANPFGSNSWNVLLESQYGTVPSVLFTVCEYSPLVH